jgi:predicted PurR-regulated permease PerM
MTDASREHRADGARVHPTVIWLSAYAWRLLVIVAALVAVLWVFGQIRVTMLSLVVAVFLSRALVPVGDWLRRRGLPPAVAAALALVGFLLTVGVALGSIGVAVVDEAEDIGPTVSDAIDDVQEWLVQDSPFPVEQDDIDRIRKEVGGGAGATLSSAGGGIASGVFVAFEVVFALFLGLVITFFVVKDGRRFVAYLIDRLPEDRRDVSRRMAKRGWDSIGGYLRGAATLGVIEGIVIAVTLRLVGAELAVPMGALTFIGAFVPFLGAIAAGVLAVLVALATGGLGAAVIVAVVVLVVQQLDNDLLAPIVYGRALSLHPVVILIAITAGGGLFGLAGSILAVPVTAVVVNMAAEARRTATTE